MKAHILRTACGNCREVSRGWRQPADCTAPAKNASPGAKPALACGRVFGRRSNKIMTSAAEGGPWIVSAKASAGCGKSCADGGVRSHCCVLSVDSTEDSRKRGIDKVHRGRQPKKWNANHFYTPTAYHCVHEGIGPTGRHMHRPQECDANGRQMPKRREDC